MSLQKIALFPIPELVSFPETVVPLHVFEPRYRSMIKDCVRERIKIGVCHIDGIIKKAPQNQDTAKILNNNQSTFKPQNVFSAGYCVIDDVTADGRFKVIRSKKLNRMFLTSSLYAKNTVMMRVLKIKKC